VKSVPASPFCRSLQIFFYIVPLRCLRPKLSNFLFWVLLFWVWEWLIGESNKVRVIIKWYTGDPLPTAESLPWVSTLFFFFVWVLNPRLILVAWITLLVVFFFPFYFFSDRFENWVAVELLHVL